MGRVAVLGVCVASLGCSSASSTPGPPQYNGIEAGPDGGDQDGSIGGDASPSDGGHEGDATNRDGATEGGDATSDAGDGGTPADTGSDGSDGSVGPPPPGPVCSQTAMWGTGTLLAISTSFDDNLGAITPDELTIAWTIGTGSSATIAYADRAAATDPFGALQMLSASSFAADRVALSPDSLRLVVVNGDRQGFSELTRTTRTGVGSAFGAPAAGSYSNFDMSGVLSIGESFGDPVLGADDAAFYYSVYGGAQTATIYRAARLLSGDAWPVGAPLPASTELLQMGSSRRRPTAISSDEQTLFFWDEVAAIERAAWLDTSTGVFTVFVDLGARRWAGPNAACNRLYYSDQPAGGSSFDLFVASD